METLNLHIPSALVQLPDGKFNTHVYFKCDFTLPTGSFKYREALAVDAIIRKYPKLKRVILTSSGNSSRAIEHLAQESKGLYEALTFNWGPATSREEAHIASLREYLNYPATETLYVIGKENPVKTKGHKLLAVELEDQLNGLHKQLAWYFQTSGSGYGCRAVAQRFPDASVFHCRPASCDLGDWAPAIIDAPPLPTKAHQAHVPRELISEAYVYLNKLMVSSEAPIGLEAATALAGYWITYAQWGAPTEGAVVVNLTGRLRGRLPW